jgi:hypothetical protein
MESPRRTLRPPVFLDSADAISKVWWPKRKRSTRLKDFAEAIARHNRMIANSGIPDYMRDPLERLPKSGRRYRVTLLQAKQYYERFVKPMPKDWYMHRDPKGHWQENG